MDMDLISHHEDVANDPLVEIGPIEVASPGDFDTTEYDPSVFSLDADSVLTSRTSSIPSTIFRHAYENGRRYHKIRAGAYPFPNDEREQWREEIKDAVFLEITRGALHFAPIGQHPQKIIDLGTGIGSWAIQAGECYPSAHVVGTDLSPIQPSWVPPNVQFKLDDVEKPWIHGPDWDYVHIRQVCLVIREVDYVCQQAFENLKPGGWIELQEFGGRILCDDGTIPADSKIRRFWKMTTDALAQRDMDWGIANYLDEYLARAGFVNIQCKKLKCPIGIWPKSKRLRVVGLFMRDVADELLDSLSARVMPLSGLSEQEKADFTADYQEEIMNHESHIYINYFFWYAQKPI